MLALKQLSVNDQTGVIRKTSLQSSPKLSRLLLEKILTVINLLLVSVLEILRQIV